MICRSADAEPDVTSSAANFVFGPQRDSFSIAACSLEGCRANYELRQTLPFSRTVTQLRTGITSTKSQLFSVLQSFTLSGRKTCTKNNDHVISGKYVVIPGSGADRASWQGLHVPKRDSKKLASCVYCSLLWTPFHG